MRLTSRQRYLTSLVAVAAVTLLAVGLVGGWVALRTRQADGTASLLSGVVIALIALLGWSVGNRLRERHVLKLPLWRRLDRKQLALVAQYRQWRRTGRVGEPPAAEAGSDVQPASGAADAGLAGLSKRDRARRAQVLAEQERRRRQGGR